MFVSRRRGQPSPHLEWRVRLFGVGAILAVAGMVAELSWMIWIALAVLAVGAALRFLPGDRDGGSTPGDDDQGRG